MPEPMPDVRALFQTRYAGDDALWELARLRFAEAGMPAELYAETPDQLERILVRLPEHRTLPTVHLDRSLDVLMSVTRERIAQYTDRFAGRLAGVVVHDQVGMDRRIPDVVAAMRELGRRSAGPHIYLEYAAGMELEDFAKLGEGLADAERAGVCIDIGHVGIRHSRTALARGLPPAIEARALTPRHPRLADVVAEVDRASRSALPALLELIQRIGSAGTRVHFHLHDGHPLIPGLADHFGFLTRVPIAVEYDGRRSLDQLYGPDGLRSILRTAVDSCGSRLSLTLEVHQCEGRLPLGDAAGLFRHWPDRTNAERLNYWLSHIAQNQLLVTRALPGSPGETADGTG